MGGADALVLATWSVLVTLLADLWQATGHLLLASPGHSGTAVTALAIAVVVGALSACLACAYSMGRISARDSADRPSVRATREVLARGLPAPA